MDFTELQQELDDDMDLNEMCLPSKLLRIPNLHNKYMRYLFRESNRLIIMQEKSRELYRDLWYHYKNNHDFLLEKKEIMWHVESDTKYTKILTKLKKQENLVDFFERAVKKCNNISFDIKNIIEYKKFMAGIV